MFTTSAKKLAFMLFLIVTTAYAQKNFRNGYFIDNNGTKTECLIENEIWLVNPTSFKYKLSENAEVNKRDIENTKEFEVEDFHYIRFIVDMDYSTNNVERMTYDKEPSFKPEQLFLRELSAGTATLYHVQAKALERFFISKNNSAPTQLVYKPYKSGSGILYNRSYKGQLYNAMKDKFSNVNDFKSVEYNIKDLIKLFEKYTGNKNESKLKRIETETKGSLNVTVYAGGGLTSIKSYVAATDENFNDTAPSTIAGLELEHRLPFNNKAWSIFTAPGFEQFSSKKSIKGYSNSSFSDYTSTVDLKYTSINIPLGLRYSLPFKENSRLSFSVAYMFFFASKSSSANYTRTYARSGQPSSLKGSLGNSNTIYLSLMYTYKRLGFELRYVPERVLNKNNTYVYTNVTSVSALLRYSVF